MGLLSKFVEIVDTTGDDRRHCRFCGLRIKSWQSGVCSRQKCHIKFLAMFEPKTKSGDHR